MTVAQNVPFALRAIPQWVLWAVETRDGHPTKVPFTCELSRASTVDPATWCSHRDATTMADSLDDNVGVGFVFTPGDPFVGVDLDACRDATTGVLHPAAQEIITDLDGYTEVSPSGTGVHIIVRAADVTLARNRTGDTPWHGSFEVYAAGRFFTVTGDALGTGSVDEDHGDRLTRVLDRMFPTPATFDEPPPAAAGRSDDEVLTAARTAVNGDKFTRLWAGGTSGYPSASEADLALCALLGFWSGDADQVERLFGRSGLADEKWRIRPDYRRRRSPRRSARHQRPSQQPATATATATSAGCRFGCSPRSSPTSPKPRRGSSPGSSHRRQKHSSWGSPRWASRRCCSGCWRASRVTAGHSALTSATSPICC